MTAVPGPVRIAALLTCHDRRPLTLACLGALARATPAGASVAVVLTDDGCTDGTADAVAAACPGARIVPGSGDLFWNRGMLTAWRAALALDVDFDLWLNDDLALEPGALADLLATYAAARAVHGERIVVVGRTIDPGTGATTYGGYVRAPGLSRLRFRHLTPDERAAGRSCATMNGNCVLIPARARHEVGLLDGRYSHAFGDIDYGLRAVERGYRIVEAPRPVGSLAANAAYAQGVARLDRTTWRFVLFHPKGVPWREWLAFCRRHGGPLWPVNVLARYLKLLRG